MKSSRHQLILLGFICQGLSWDDWLLPVVYALAWVVGLTLPRRPLRLGPVGECTVLALGCAVGYGVSALLGRNTHFFIGHGLACLQLARLLRPLNRREKLFSFFIACFHLGVACTFVFDLRFVWIFLGTLVLVPRALHELAREGFEEPELAPAPRGPSWRMLAVMLVFTVAFFFTVPRLFVGPPLQMRMFGGGDGSLRESVIDSARSGLAQSRRVLMQIEGESIGYLRCFSLVDTDGTRWLAAERSPLKRFDYRSREQLAPFNHRRVRVKNAGFLERLLPTDGQPVFAMGNFLTRPFLNGHGGVEAVGMWNTANNIYEYWIEPKPKPEGLFPALRQRYTRAPAASPRVRAWLDDVLAGTADPYARARRLEGFLRDRFTYEVGAPELNRLNAQEDFLFNQQAGHCERFAAALALLLRQIDIPSRMVIGYLPQARNFLTGATVVRFKDAHAWTEAWFEGRGWVTLDATPPVQLKASSWSLRGLLDDLDLAWSSYVVNLDAPTQRQLFTVSVDALRDLPGWLARHQSLWAFAMAGMVLLLVLWRWRRANPWNRRGQGRSVAQAQIFAGTVYGRMLQLLARAGFRRHPAETPMEFLAGVRAGGYACWTEVEHITRLFCATRYGGRTLSPDERQSIETSLQRLREAGWPRERT